MKTDDDAYRAAARARVEAIGATVAPHAAVLPVGPPDPGAFVEVLLFIPASTLGRPTFGAFCAACGQPWPCGESH